MPFTAATNEPCTLPVLHAVPGTAYPGLLPGISSATACSMPLSALLSLLCFARTRLSASLMAGLTLVGTGCGTSPAQVPVVDAAPTLVQTKSELVPVAPLIQQLLRATSARAELRAFYDSTYVAAWTGPTGALNPDAHATLALLARAAEHGLRLADYDVAGLHSLRDSLALPAKALQRAAQRAQLDVTLSEAALRFGSDLGRGRLHPYTLTAKEKKSGAAGQPAALLRAANTGSYSRPWPGGWPAR